jgi:hypothetical protein
MATTTTATDTSSPSLVHAFGPSIWTVEGPIVQFFGCPYPTRMALIQLENGGVWVWSPVKLTDELRLELKAQQLDKIAYIVSPNKIHHIFLKEWQEAFPQAKLYAPPGLKERTAVKDVTFHALLEDAISLFSEEISQVIVKGSSVMEEVVFYHAKSQTALVADLIQRFPEHQVEGFMGMLLKWDGLVGPNGSTPREWRFSFLFGKDQARKARDIIINDWKPQHLIIAHGDCVTDGSATTVIGKALGWLDPMW